MKKAIGGFLVFLGALLILASISEVVVMILPSISDVVSTGGIWEWGLLIGRSFGSILFLLFGGKAIKAGRRRFTNQLPSQS